MIKLFQAMYNKLYLFFFSGHERTVKAKKNIAITFLIKGLGILFSLLLVPLTINYLNQSQYGIWITLYSIFTWFSFFDIGLGNGLKNKIVENNSNNKVEQSKIYVSTTYAIIGIMAFAFLIVFIIGNKFIDWNKILNTPDIGHSELSHLALIVFGLFCFQFALQLIDIILTAHHAVSEVSIMGLISQLISLIAICILKITTKGSLTYIVFALAGAPVLVNLVASILYYRGRYKLIAPSFRYVNFRHGKSLLGIGGLFFLIQLGGLVLFQTDNIVITQLFGPASVTVFNIAYKMFSMVIMLFTIIVTPFWSAFTEAYTKEDFIWIKNVFSKMYQYWAGASVLCIIILLTSKQIINLWVKGVSVPMDVSLALAIYTIEFCWLLIHCYLLNGISKIKLQLYLYIGSTLVNIPMAIFLGKKFGIAGVTYSNNIVLLIMGIVLYIQCKKILNKSATGVWNT